MQLCIGFKNKKPFYNIRPYTGQKMRKSLMENFIFCAVLDYNISISKSKTYKTFTFDFESLLLKTKETIYTSCSVQKFRSKLDE